LLRFRNFVNTLETAFCNITGVSRDLLRKCLYKNQEYDFNILNPNMLDGLYYTIAYFYKFYNRRQTSINSKLFAESIKNIYGCKSDVYNNRSLLFDLVNNIYIKYIVINISEENEAILKITKDLKRDDNESINTLNECCLKEGQDLIAVKCDNEDHEEIIDEIRDVFCKTMPLDFASRETFFYKRIVWLIEARFNFFSTDWNEIYPEAFEDY
ncbi:hypothetical protein CDIK_4492, partial [Cucumispora dikerogammari]